MCASRTARGKRRGWVQLKLPTRRAHRVVVLSPPLLGLGRPVSPPFTPVLPDTILAVFLVIVVSLRLFVLLVFLVIGPLRI